MDLIVVDNGHSVMAAEPPQDIGKGLYASPPADQRFPRQRARADGHAGDRLAIQLP